MWASSRGYPGDLLDTLNIQDQRGNERGTLVAADRSGTIHPLWQLLSSVDHSGNNATLTCEECCDVLEYYADRIAAGADPGNVGRMARRHLERCPDCHERYAEWLDEMERAVRQDLEQETVDLKAPDRPEGAESNSLNPLIQHG